MRSNSSSNKTQLSIECTIKTFFSFFCIFSFSCIFSSINIFFFVSDKKKIECTIKITKWPLNQTQNNFNVRALNALEKGTLVNWFRARWLKSYQSHEKFKIELWNWDLTVDPRSLAESCQRWNLWLIRPWLLDPTIHPGKSLKARLKSAKAPGDVNEHAKQTFKAPLKGVSELSQAMSNLHLKVLLNNGLWWTAISLQKWHLRPIYQCHEIGKPLSVFCVDKGFDMKCEECKMGGVLSWKVATKWVLGKVWTYFILFIY